MTNIRVHFLGEIGQLFSLISGPTVYYLPKYKELLKIYLYIQFFCPQTNVAQLLVHRDALGGKATEPRFIYT